MIPTLLSSYFRPCIPPTQTKQNETDRSLAEWTPRFAPRCSNSSNGDITIRTGTLIGTQSLGSGLSPRGRRSGIRRQRLRAIAGDRWRARSEKSWKRGRGKNEGETRETNPMCGGNCGAGIISHPFPLSRDNIRVACGGDGLWTLEGRRVFVVQEEAGWDEKCRRRGGRGVLGWSNWATASLPGASSEPFYLSIFSTSPLLSFTFSPGILTVRRSPIKCIAGVGEVGCTSVLCLW